MITKRGNYIHNCLQHLTIGAIQRGPGALGIGLENPEQDVDQIPPYSAQVTNEWSCTSAPPIYLHRMGRDKFIYLLLVLEINQG
jgi:hypothetical protein